MGCGTLSLTGTDKVVTAFITLIYVTMPPRGGVPAIILFAVLELVVHQINAWQNRRQDVAYFRGMGFAY